jgi:hypothetical protein
LWQERLSDNSDSLNHNLKVAALCLATSNKM